MASEVVENVRQLFLDPNHPVYTRGGTPSSSIGPASIFHIGQVEVLFEDQYFHWITNDALKFLRASGFLAERAVPMLGSLSTVVWRSNLRYVERPIRAHMELLESYSSSEMSRATGQYAETLALLGLGLLGLKLVARNSRRFGSRIWDKTDHDLDFILEREGIGYGVEVKNTFPYMENAEIAVKLDMCDHLGLVPLFIVRTRHAGQYRLVGARGGLIYMGKTKVFPPGQEELARSIWNQMRLPVAVRQDMNAGFYKAVSAFLPR